VAPRQSKHVTSLQLSRQVRQNLTSQTYFGGKKKPRKLAISFILLFYSQWRNSTVGIFSQKLQGLWLTGTDIEGICNMSFERL
jgi:hypothetical protein